VADFAVDLARARWDVDFFAWRFLGIRLHPGQKRLAKAYLRRSKGGWRALYLWIMVSAGNRAGKTMMLAIIILHSCIFRMGQKPPDELTEAALKRWRELPYHAFHFALQQENAELVHGELWAMLEGRHPAQKAKDADGNPVGCPLVNELGMDNVLAQPIDKKYRGDYAWIVLSQRLGGAEIHFRSVAEKALGSLGRDMHLVSLDEAGLIGPKLPFILSEVLHFRRLGTGGQFILISTPSEDTGPEFADLWYTGDPDSGDYKPRRFSMRMSTRDNVGYGLDRAVFEAMIDGVDEAIVAQNIDGYFIQGRAAYFNAQSVERCFVDWLPEAMEPQRAHSYVQGVDPAKTQDSAWSIVLDVLFDGEGEPHAVGVWCEQMGGRISTPHLVALAAEPQNLYDDPVLGSHCSTAIDATGFGGKLFKEALELEVPRVRAIEFGGSIQKKRKLLGDLRTMIDEGRLFLPRKGLWLKVRRQLLGYKLDDRKIEQDAVMALACAIAEVRRTPLAGKTSLPFSYHVDDDADELPEGDGRRWAMTPFRHPRRAAS